MFSLECLASLTPVFLLWVILVKNAIVPLFHKITCGNLKLGLCDTGASTGFLRFSKHFCAVFEKNPTSLQTAAIWASSMHVSVTTSVREPPARYSITTKSSSPTRKLQMHTGTVTSAKQLTHSWFCECISVCVCLCSVCQVSVTCLQSWQCWGSSAPS